MGKDFKLLNNIITASSEIWIKYSYYIKPEAMEFYGEKVLVDSIPGAVKINSLSNNQKFYSSLQMIQSSQESLKSVESGGRRITRIRDIIFVDSQLYVDLGDNHVLKMKDDKGFISLKISETEYRSIVRQLKGKTE